jgi:NAD(P)-dependent dehydrogenase (short-subunit alcohol dehydrogenase family)
VATEPKPRLAGRRALVTGASRGIGEAIARLFAAEGARVALLARDGERLRVLAEELGSVPAPADISHADEVAAAVAEAARALGGLDALVNAAAVDCEWKPTAELSVESWDETVAVNLSGTFYVCRAALPLLVAAGGGAIVNLTSVAAHRVWPEDVAYGASKAGVEMLTRTVAVEYAPHGIRANALAPGVIDAGMTDLVEDEQERSELAAASLLGRLGRADEVAEAALWLASDASAFVTGTTLVVDGGFLLA